MFEFNNYDGSLDNLESFVKIQEANKAKNAVDFVLAYQLIGDIYRHFSKFDQANTAYTAAFSAFNHSKEVSTRYPGFGPILQARVEEEVAAPPVSAGGLFARITGELGRLSDEVKTGGPSMQCDPEEVELRNSILFDD